MFTQFMKFKPWVTQPTTHRRWKYGYMQKILVSDYSQNLGHPYKFKTSIHIYTCIDPIVKGRQLINWIRPLLTSYDVQNNNHFHVFKSNMMGECRPQHLPRGRVNWGGGGLGWWKRWLLLYNPNNYALSRINP